MQPTNTKEDKLIDKMKGSLAKTATTKASPASTLPQPAGLPQYNATNVIGPTGVAAQQQTTDNLRRALRISESTNQSGYATVQSLGRQRETIQHSLLTVDETHQQLAESRGILRQIRLAVYKEWFVKGCVIAALVMLIIFIIYVKFVRRK